MVLYLICPVAWLKMKIKIISVSNFPGFLGILKVGLFLKMGEKPYVKAIQEDVFSQFFKGTAIK